MLLCDDVSSPKGTSHVRQQPQVSFNPALQLLQGFRPLKFPGCSLNCYAHTLSVLHMIVT
eukprot:275603-Amphidinium_carterae.1